jgi:hypothetical protein
MNRSMSADAFEELAVGLAKYVCINDHINKKEPLLQRVLFCYNQNRKEGMAI